MMGCNVLNKDIIQCAVDWYSSISIRYKMAFYVSSVVTILFFSIFITQFLLHNHEIRLPWVEPSHQIPHGRWFSFVFINLFYGADVPVLIPLASSIISVISGLLVVTIWARGRELSTATLICITLLITLYPAMLSSYYFTWTTELTSCAIVLSLLGLYVASALSVWRILAGAAFIMCAMATYQVCLSVFATVFMGLVILEVAEHPGGFRHFWMRSKEVLLPKLLAIILGAIFYRISLPLFGINTGASHATKTISLHEFPFRLKQVFIESFLSLRYTQPELLYSVKIILLLVSIYSILFIIYFSLRNCTGVYCKIIKFNMLIFLFVVMIVSTKSLYLVSDNNNFPEYRYNISLGFFYSFVFFIIFLQSKRVYVNNIILMICLYVIFQYGQADLVRQGVLLRGQMHDISLANRILSRVESLPDINLEEKYFFIRAGAYPRIRMNSLRSKGHIFDRHGDSHMDRGEITDIWCPANLLVYLGSKIQWKNPGYTPDFKKKIEIARRVAEEQGRKPWPHLSSVFIYEDMVIVYM